MGYLCVSPTPRDVRNLLSDLLGKTVELDASGQTRLRGAADVAAVAIYVSETGALAALVACDVVLGASLGAALALLPAGLVAENEDAGSLNEDVGENLAEIFNVMTTLLNAEGRPRIALDGVIVSPDPIPAPVAKMLGSAVGHLPLKVEVPGYGAGDLTVVTR